MKVFTSVLGIIILNLNIISQEEIRYDEPPKIRRENYLIQCSDIISTAEKCKLKLTIENKSESNFLYYKYSQVGFEYENIGTYFPVRGKDVVIFPGKKAAKVVSVSKKIDYRVAAFNIVPQGLYSGVKGDNLAINELVISADNLASLEVEGLEVKCTKYTSKKGKVSIELELVNNGSDNNLILVSPSLISVNNSIEFDLNNSDEKVLQKGKKIKTKISFNRYQEEYKLDLSKVFNIINLSKLTVEKIKITNNVVQTNVSTPTQCPPFKAPKDGSILVRLYNKDGVCFKVDVDGFPVVTEFTSNAIVYVNPGRKRLKFTFVNGFVLEDKKFIPDTHLEMGFRIKEKGSGEYVLKSVLGDQVMTAEAKQESEDMMIATQQRVAEMQAEHKRKDTKSSTGGSSASGTTNNSSGSSCYGESSSGAESVKLKITWQGAPLKGYGIQVKNGTTPFGNNVTDDSGNVTIKVSSLVSRNINVFGCKGSSNWSVTGSWVVLDNSNYFHLKLDELAGFMAEMMGISISEIKSGWGIN